MPEKVVISVLVVCRADGNDVICKQGIVAEGI